MTLTREQLPRIFNNQLGLRVGINIDGAAYSMSDFGPGDLSVIFQWVYNPDLNGERFQKWGEHLYNTIWLIDNLSAQEYNLLMVTRAVPTAESYLAQGGIGDMQTFRKCNRLANLSAIAAQQTFNQGQIQQAIDWVLSNI